MVMDKGVVGESSDDGVIWNGVMSDMMGKTDQCSENVLRGTLLLQTRLLQVYSDNEVGFSKDLPSTPYR